MGDVIKTSFGNHRTPKRIASDRADAKTLGRFDELTWKLKHERKVLGHGALFVLGLLGI